MTDSLLFREENQAKTERTAQKKSC